MSEVTRISQSLQYCQNKLDLAMEHFDDLVNNAVDEDKDEEKMALLTFIHNSTKTFEKYTKKLFEEPKVKDLKKISIETSEKVPEKKLKLSPSPLMDLPNEIWMKILEYLPTYDILKNFNLTCKQFHSLAISPGAIKSLQLKVENFKESTQYQEIVKVLKRSKTLTKLVINGYRCGHMNHILAHALKSNHLKTLEVSLRETAMTNKNLEYMKNSSIEELKLDNILLDDDAMQKIGALKTLKSVRISNSLAVRQMNISELIKTFIDVKIGLEDLDVFTCSNQIEINASTLYEFLKEKAGTLKKLKVICIVRNDDRKEDMIWNVPANLEELYYYNCGDRNLRTIKIELGLDMPRLTKLAIRNIDGAMINMLGTQNFPALERLYLSKAYDNRNGPNVSQQTIFNFLENCPNLKSLKIMCHELMDPQPVDVWCAFLCEMYKNYNAYLNLTSYYHSGSFNSLWQNFEKNLKETDLATFYKYTKMKANYLDWKKEQLPNEW